MPTQMPPPPRPPSSQGTNRYLVSYDLLGNPSHQRYERIDSVLKSKYRATEVLLSDWILNTEESGPSIFNTLRGLTAACPEQVGHGGAGDPHMRALQGSFPGFSAP